MREAGEGNEGGCGEGGHNDEEAPPFSLWVKAVAQAAVIPGHRTDRGLEVSCVVWRHTPPPPASCELPPVDFPLCADRILGGIPGWAGPRRRAYRACPRTTLTLSSCSLAFPCLFA